MSDVFISYSRRNKDFTQKLYEALTAAGRTVWADWDSIPAASDWFAEIKEGIEQTDSVVFVLSPDWIKSGECRKELEYAVEMGKRLFPIIWQPVDPNQVPPELAKINWVYLRESDDFEKGFQTLCSALDTDLEWIKSHTRIQVRAMEWNNKHRDHSFVLRGKDLEDGESFLSKAAHKNPEPTSLQGEYVLVSRKDATRRQRMTLMGVTLALVISAVLGVVAFFQRQAAVAAQAEAVVAEAEAVREKDRAVSAEATAVAERDRANVNAEMSFARELAASSISELGSDPERSILLAVHAANTAVNAGQPIPYEVENAVRLAVQESRIRYALFDDDTVYDIQSVSFSPDGNYMATGSWSGKLILWDVSGEPKKERNLDSVGPVQSVAFSPDASRLASTSYDDLAVVVWDVSSGDKILTLSGHSDHIWHVAFSPDGRYLATASADGNVKLWDSNSGNELRTMLGHEAVVRSVAFSPDGTQLASVDENGLLVLWNVETGTNIFSHQGDVLATDVAFNPDGSSLAVSDYGGGVYVLDIASNAVAFTRNYHSAVASSVAYSPDGSLLATGSWDTTAIVMDAKSGLIKYSLNGSSGDILSVAFNPQGTMLATVGDFGVIRLWDAKPASEGEAATLLPEVGGINGLAFNPEGDQIAIAGDAPTAVLWNISNGNPLRLEGHEQALTSLAFSPDGRNLLTGSWDARMILWIADSGTIQKTFDGNGKPVLAVKFSRDGSFLAAGVGDTVVVWHGKSGEQKLTLPSVNPGYGFSEVDFNTDGTIVAGINDDWLTSLWDVPSGDKIRTLEGHSEWGQSLAFSPNGEQLLTGSSDRTAILWNVATGEQVFVLEHASGVTSVGFSPDGTLIATASQDGMVKVWNADTGSLLSTFAPHAGSINTVVFSPDQKLIAFGGADGVVRMSYLDVNSVLELASERVTRSLTEKECEIYLHTDQCPVD